MVISLKYAASFLANFGKTCLNFSTNFKNVCLNFSANFENMDLYFSANFLAKFFYWGACGPPTPLLNQGASPLDPPPLITLNMSRKSLQMMPK